VVLAAFSGYSFISKKLILINTSSPHINFIESQIMDAVAENADALQKEIEKTYPPSASGWARILPWNWMASPQIPASKGDWKREAERAQDRGPDVLARRGHGGVSTGPAIVCPAHEEGGHEPAFVERIGLGEGDAGRLALPDVRREDDRGRLLEAERLEGLEQVGEGSVLVLHRCGVEGARACAISVVEAKRTVLQRVTEQLACVPRIEAEGFLCPVGDLPDQALASVMRKCVRIAAGGKA